MSSVHQNATARTSAMIDAVDELSALADELASTELAICELGRRGSAEHCVDEDHSAVHHALVRIELRMRDVGQRLVSVTSEPAEAAS